MACSSSSPRRGSGPPGGGAPAGTGVQERADLHCFTRLARNDSSSHGLGTAGRGMQGAPHRWLCSPSTPPAPTGSIWQGARASHRNAAWTAGALEGKGSAGGSWHAALGVLGRRLGAMRAGEPPLSSSPAAQSEQTWGAGNPMGTPASTPDASGSAGRAGSCLL